MCFSVLPAKWNLKIIITNYQRSWCAFTILKAGHCFLKKTFSVLCMKRFLKNNTDNLTIWEMVDCAVNSYFIPNHLFVEQHQSNCLVFRKKPVDWNRISQTDIPMNACSRKDANMCFKNKSCRVKQFDK